MPQQLEYVLRRVLYAIAAIFVLASTTFLLMHLLPGEPFTGAKPLASDVKEALAVKYGLNLPLWQQYGIYLMNLLQGDMGVSLVSKREVTDIIAQAFPVSMELGLRALIFAVVIGIGLGIVAGLKRGTVWDTSTMLVALVGVSIPSFILGSLLQYFFSVVLFQATGVHLLPVMGWTNEASKILPSFTLAFGTIAIISRLMRASLVEVMGQDYIKAARAKGLSQRALVIRHALRNSIIPVVTVLGPITALLLTGTFVVENIFAIPGLGKYFVESVRSNDYTVIIGTTLFFGSILILCNLAVDVLHSVIDPRIKLESKNR